jgi:DNA-directed RNA polymerase subunit omega
MNAILVQRALAKVPNCPVLINIVSRRVRQLNSGNGGECRPLLTDRGSLSAADTALLEIIEDRLTFELPEILPLRRPTQQGKRPSGWARM